jgi:hypothetical protein
MVCLSLFQGYLSLCGLEEGKKSTCGIIYFCLGRQFETIHTSAGGGGGGGLGVSFIH